MSDYPEQAEAHQYAAFTQRVMKQQAALSLRVAAIFIILVLGLPLFNLYYPKIAAKSVFGFSLTWLILGVCFFPLTWILSSYFVRESDKIEIEAAKFRIVSGGGDADDDNRSQPALTMTDEEGKR